MYTIRLLLENDAFLSWYVRAAEDVPGDRKNVGEERECQSRARGIEKKLTHLHTSVKRLQKAVDCTYYDGSGEEHYTLINIKGDFC